MLRKFDKILPYLQQISDFFIANAAWCCAYYLRFKVLSGQSGLEDLFFRLSLVAGIITVLCMRRFGLYKSQRFNRRIKEVSAVFMGNFASVILIVILLYFFTDDRISRIFIGLYALVSTFTLIAFRMIIRNFLRSMRKKGYNLRHYLLVGDGQQVASYIHAIQSYKDCGINIIGWLDSEGQSDKFPNIKKLEGSVDDLKVSHKPDSIIAGFSGKNGAKLENFLKASYNDLTPIQILPDIPYTFVGNQIEDFAGVPILNMNRPNITDWDRFVKRTFDLISCGFGIILISPLLFFIGLIVKVTSPGPIFYKQERVGLDGTKFDMLKFRTMKVATEGEDQTEWSNKDNPRKTAFGDFLRKSSLDELPQLINVILGHMSLVGPRPERPFFVDKFKEEIPAYMLRHKMKAGITGWAQVNGWRGDTSLNERISCDLYYIRNWTFFLDIKIIFLTFWKGFFNKNAY